MKAQYGPYYNASAYSYPQYTHVPPHTTTTTSAYPGYTVPYPYSSLPKTALPTATSAWSSGPVAASGPISDVQRIVTDLNGLFATK